MKVHLRSIGCRLNQSEIESLARQLLALGHELVNNAAEADKVIINTCAVTREAARDARAQTRRIQRHNTRAELFLTGCYATIDPQALKELGERVQVVDNQGKANLITLLDPRASSSLPLFDQEPVMREFLGRHMGNTRAFVKVQDGCNHRCTFCVTTVARGAASSRRPADVIAEIRSLCAAGYQEVVLTGVHLGSYGQDLGEQANLAGLVRAILEYTEVPRLRLSSLEPWDLAPDFFQLWQNSRLLPHLHMPLQSGSDRILRRMARRTSQHSFRHLVREARTHIAHLSLSTDMIVGFPGETEADFEGSLEFVREMEFSRLHAFSFSPRPGTAASRFPDQVRNDVKKARMTRMLALGEALSLAYHQRFEGATRPVLWEQHVGAQPEGLLWSGYSDNYIRVLATGPVDLYNTITPTLLHRARADGTDGRIATR